MADCETLLNTIGDPFPIVAYNGNQIGGENISPPFITTDTEFIQAGERWVEKEIWTLQGQILDCESLAGLWAKQDTLVTIFSVDYKDLEVGNPAAAGITLNDARLTNIQFASIYFHHTNKHCP